MLGTIGISCVISFCLVGGRGHPLAELKSHNGDDQQLISNLRNISAKSELLTTVEPIQTSKDNFTPPVQTTQSLNSTPRLSLVYRPGRPTFAGQISTGLINQLIHPGKPWPAVTSSQSPTLVDRFGETTVMPTPTLSSPKPTTKSPLEYKPQKPSYAGILSEGHLGQLVPSGESWPENPTSKPQVINIEDRFKETTAKPFPEVPTQIVTTKPSLDYQPQRPTFAGSPGGISGGHLGQLIPPGKPWPADPPIKKPILSDRLKETTVTPIVTTRAPFESKPQKPSFVEVLSEENAPLEYQPQRPTFAGSPGGISGGHLGSLIPPGKPWPADPPVPSPTLEDRLKETTAVPLVTTKKPLDFQPPMSSSTEVLSEGNQPQRPSFAGSPGGISGGHLGSLIPPGKPWPADPPNLILTLEDRLKETTASPIVTTKAPLFEGNSPLEYQPQRPSFAGSPGGISGGHLGSLIPPGKPWPADAPNLIPTLEDRLKETTVAPTVTTKAPLSVENSPLEYQPQRPTFAGSPGGISGGHLGSLIPPGKPWPADPPNLILILEDRLKETTASPIVTTKAPSSFTQNSPLEYQPQRPTYAGSPGGISGGHLGSLIPPGKPWPADPSNLIPTLEDRLKETTAIPIVTTKVPLSEENSPLEYQPQRPTFAGSPGGISGGHLGSLIPPGKPWPADPPILSPTLEDRFKETTVASTVTTKPPLSEGISHLEFQPQRPTFAGSQGGISGGHLGSLIPPGKPWPADPPILSPTLEDRFKETTVAASVTTKPPLSEEISPLEYQPERPTFAGLPGGISGGFLGQLIPPGKPWPAGPSN